MGMGMGVPLVQCDLGQLGALRRGAGWRNGSLNRQRCSAYWRRTAHRRGGDCGRRRSFDSSSGRSQLRNRGKRGQRVTLAIVRVVVLGEENNLWGVSHTLQC